MLELSWVGVEVRHRDGLQGVIIHEDTCGGHKFCKTGLVIEIKTGGIDYVELSSDGLDAGARGWSWWCENFDGGGRWLPLGDHNKKIKEDGNV